MSPIQFANIYQNLVNDAQSLPKHKIFSLGSMCFENEIDAVLYLPLFSLGLVAHGMPERIEHLKLKAEGNSLDFFLKSPLEDLEEICTETMQNGKIFGDFFIRLYEIRKRAKKIQEKIADNVVKKIRAPSDFPSKEKFVAAIKFLKDFHGIGEISAQHILMDLGWPIVKPDRHIQRILFRLGGWDNFFNSEEGNKNFSPEEWYVFQQKWHSAVTGIINFSYENSEIIIPNNILKINQLNSRKIDICLMWFSQKQKSKDETLSAPRCTETPLCKSCSVPNCKLRRDGN